MDSRVWIALLLAAALIALSTLAGCRCSPGSDTFFAVTYAEDGSLDSAPPAARPYDSLLHSFRPRDFRAGNTAMALEPLYNPYLLSTSSQPGVPATGLSTA